MIWQSNNFEVSQKIRITLYQFNFENIQNTDNKKHCYITGDVHCIEGEEIPYFKFGYRTLELFLKDIPNDIRLFQKEGKLIVRAKISEETAHIHNLIKNQQKKSKKKSARKVIAYHSQINNFKLSLKYSKIKIIKLFIFLDKIKYSKKMEQ